MHCSFSLDHYKECIELAKDKGYFIKPVGWYVDIADPEYTHTKDRKLILMRHDIDWSLENAYDLANIEYDLGICSTYYVYLHSELYNALSPNSVKMMQQMKGMGHEIGLHTEGTNYLFSEEEILSDIIGPIKSYTFHLPGLRHDLKLSGLLNPKELKIKFISDSGRNWRSKCLCQNIGKYDKLHVLMHPEWWVGNSSSRDDAVNKLWQAQQHTLFRNMTDIKQMLVEYVRNDLKQ